MKAIDIKKAFVLDTSVAMGWLFKDEETNHTRAILENLSKGYKAYVPSLFFLEVGNALLVAERRKRITQNDSKAFLNLLMALPIKRIDHLELESIAAIGRKSNLSFYDSTYLWLAYKLCLPIATLDNALKKSVAAEGLELYP